ncbi:REP-associated tyrosine transposase [Methylobacter sp.]|uniref:REP-associated tyrosine transposase n=1 Tax=Methylobacter sp. TaxID=2051955 RepID=UPI002FDE0162
MSNYRRVYVPGGLYFFTVKTFRNQRFLIDDDVRGALREGIEFTRQSKPFDIVAWVLLPNHLHCIWRLPPGDADFSARWSMIKRTVTQRCSARLNRPEWQSARRLKRQQGTLWQHRYWDHLIRDEDDFNRHMNYVHWNPVKHGFAAKVADWPYSSFHRLVRSGWYVESWGAKIVFDDNCEFGE